MNVGIVNFAKTSPSNFAFKSGFSQKDLKVLKCISSKKAQDVFETSAIKTELKNNQTISILNLICSEILTRLGVSQNFPNVRFCRKPAEIRIFDSSEALRNLPDTFCTVKNARILKDYVTLPISLMYKNDSYTIEEMNALAEKMRAYKFISDDNFLSPIMHEWMHSIHLNYLYNECNLSEKEVVFIMQRLKKYEFSNLEKELIAKYLGTYVYNQGNISGAEVVAEGLNKIVCCSLDKKQLRFSNTFDEATKNIPKELLDLIRRLLYNPIQK